MSDERHLKDMTVADWKQRVENLRSMLIEAEQELWRAEKLAQDNSPLVQAVLSLAKRPVRM